MEQNKFSLVIEKPHNSSYEKIEERKNFTNFKELYQYIEDYSNESNCDFQLYQYTKNIYTQINVFEIIDLNKG